MTTAVGIAIAAVAAYAVWQQFGTAGPAGHRVEVLDPAKVVLIRTEGGHLQASELRRVEEFGWQTGWSCPILDCSKLPKTTSKVRVTAHYVYRIPLAAEWRLEPEGGQYRLTVPPVQLQSPVGIDTTDLQIATEQSLFSPAAAPNREMLLRHLGPELARRGASAPYVDLQQRMAEQTVREFAQKWMHRDGRTIDRPIRVVFTGPNPG